VDHHRSCDGQEILINADLQTRDNCRPAPERLFD